jgi:hypothetical protein
MQVLPMRASRRRLPGKRSTQGAIGALQKLYRRRHWNARAAAYADGRRGRSIQQRRPNRLQGEIRAARRADREFIVTALDLLRRNAQCLRAESGADDGYIARCRRRQHCHPVLASGPPWRAAHGCSLCGKTVRKSSTKSAQCATLGRRPRRRIRQIRSSDLLSVIP